MSRRARRRHARDRALIGSSGPYAAVDRRARPLGQRDLAADGALSATSAGAYSSTSGMRAYASSGRLTLAKYDRPFCICQFRSVSRMACRSSRPAVSASSDRGRPLVAAAIERRKVAIRARAGVQGEQRGARPAVARVAPKRRRDTAPTRRRREQRERSGATAGRRRARRRRCSCTRTRRWRHTARASACARRRSIARQLHQARRPRAAGPPRRTAAADRTSTSRSDRAASTRGTFITIVSRQSDFVTSNQKRCSASSDAVRRIAAAATASRRFQRVLQRAGARRTRPRARRRAASAAIAIRRAPTSSRNSA